MAIYSNLLIKGSFLPYYISKKKAFKSFMKNPSFVTSSFLTDAFAFAKAKGPNNINRVCKVFSSSRFYNPFWDLKAPPFLSAQKKSFQSFLNQGLIHELEQVKKITNSDHSLELSFYPKKYRLVSPKWNPKQTILKRKTYACGLYIPAQLTNYKTQQVVLKWFFICHLPLMTKNGHFIINGSLKMIMNQIVRSPGVYFQKVLKSNKRMVYSADFIAQRGTWLRLEMDNEKEEIWAKLKKTPKLPLFLFLRCFGTPPELLCHYFNFYAFFPKTQKQLYFKDMVRNLPRFKSSSLITKRHVHELFAMARRKEALKKVYSEDASSFILPVKLKLKEMKKIKKIKRAGREKTFLDPFFSHTKSAVFDCFSQNLHKVSPHLQTSKKESEKVSKRFLYRKFFNSRLYNLSLSGRLRINQTLGLNTPLNHTVLTPKDVLFACFYLIECQKGFRNPTDIDNLQNRKIRPAGELIQNQMAVGLFRFEKAVRERMMLFDSSLYLSGDQKKFNNPRNVQTSSLFLSPLPRVPFFGKSVYKNTKKTQESNSQKDNFFVLKEQLEILLSSTLVQTSLREFFGTNPLCQLLDQTNPLAEMTHKRRLSSLGFGGISRDSAGMAIRGIHPTHYGRICPIETPEGQNAGLVNSFTIHSHLNNKGIIETPFYQVHKGFVLQKKVHLFSPDQEKDSTLGPADIYKNKLNSLPVSISIPCRQQNKFTRLFRNEIDFMGVSPLQMISIGTSLIPFLEHDDGNRALMGSNMQRQSVPTLKPSLPIVGTGLESKIIADIHHGLQINKTGFVSYVDGTKIIIYSSRDGLNNIDLIKSHIKLKKNTKQSIGINKNRHIEKFKSIVDQASPTVRKGATTQIEFKRALVSKGFCFNKTFDAALSPSFYCFNSKQKFGFDYVFDPLLKPHNKWLMEKNNLLNSKQLFTIFNSGFSNGFLVVWEWLKLFSNKKALGIDQNNKEQLFLSQTRLKWLKLHYSKSTLVMYSKRLLANRYYLLERKTYKTQKNFNDFRFVIPCKNGGFYFKKALSISGLLPSIFKVLIPFFHQIYNSPVYYSPGLPGVKKSKGYSKSSKTIKISKKINTNVFKNENTVKKKFKHTLSDRPSNMDLLTKFTLKKNLIQKNIAFFSNFNHFYSQTKHQQNNPFIFYFNLPALKWSSSTYVFALGLKQMFFYGFSKKALSIDQSSFDLSTTFVSSMFSCKGVKKGNYTRGWTKGWTKDCTKEAKRSKNNITQSNMRISMHYDTKQSSGLCYFYDVSNVFFSSSFTAFFLNRELLKKKKTVIQPASLPLCSVRKVLETKQNRKNLTKPSCDSLIPITYCLDPFFRSNQDTYLCHRPIVEEGQWVEKRDIIADNASSKKGQLALGQNLLIAYMPWEGYNFEDAVLMSNQVISNDLFTILHIERYQVEVKNTTFGDEQITNQLPNFDHDNSVLDHRGIVKLGSWVEPGDILVGKITPSAQKTLSSYEKLLYDIIGKETPVGRDTSLRVPLGVKGRVIHVELVETQKVSISKNKKPKKIKKNQKLKKSRPVKSGSVSSLKGTKVEAKEKRAKLVPTVVKGSVLSFGSRAIKLKIGRRHLQMNLSHLKLKLYQVINKRLNKEFANSVGASDFLFGKSNFVKTGSFTSLSKTTKKTFLFTNPREGEDAIKKTKGQTLIQRLTKQTVSINTIHRLNQIKKKVSPFRYSLLGPSSLELQQSKVKIDENKVSKKKDSKSSSSLKKNKKALVYTTKEQQFVPLKVHIYIAEKRHIQVGDKMAGRHGNKGIISSILPRQDMPYLPDGTPIDLVLNPLGVPSRMNVGQIFECLLGLAGYYLGQNYKIQPFDEIYGCEASRSLVYLKLYEAKMKTGQNWLFNPNFPGKVRLFDGRTGECFDQPITIGYAYMLKLIHQVDEKIHARSTGPYSLVTQQPLRGRSKQGGQRVGEMEVWALEGFGAAYILQELLTIKSDDLKGRDQVNRSILENEPFTFGMPESFKVLVKELQALCLDITISKKE